LKKNTANIKIECGW